MRVLALDVQLHQLQTTQHPSEGSHLTRAVARVRWHSSTAASPRYFVAFARALIAADIAFTRS
jgi:hypothetical protein